MKPNKQTKKQLHIDGGRHIVLFDMLASGSEVNTKDMECNVYCVDNNGVKIWQINNVKPIYERSPFTNIYFDEHGNLFAYNWDGTIYSVNVETGFAEPIQLVK